MNSNKPTKPQSAMQVQNPGAKSGSGLGREIQVKIGQQLRAMYDDVVQEGVPDRFVELLQQLDKQPDEGSSK